MADAGKEQAIRVIVFDGKKTSWSSWKEKFLAKAKSKGYKPVLTGETEVTKYTEAISEDDPNREEKLKAQELNETAYADLILSIDTSL